jgi:ankyrin repeat protein
MVQLLLDAKASVKKTNNLGYTSLFYSAQQEHHDISQLLLDNGADPKKAGGEIDLSMCTQRED